MDENTPRVSAAYAKAGFSEIMRRVQQNRERIIVTNHNRDAMAVIPVNDLKDLLDRAKKEGLSK